MSNLSSARTSTKSLRIAYCLPELRPLDTIDASFQQQMRIAEGLKTRGHGLTFVAQRNLSETVCTANLDVPRLAPRTWSHKTWFRLAGKSAWRVQRWLGIPYLNVFSNYSVFDACLRCLPGHDVVHERNGLYRAGVSMACRHLKLPYVLFFDGDDIFEHDITGDPIKGMLRWRAQQVIRYSMNTAQRIICVSAAAKSRLVSVWRVPEEKVAIFPNAVDVGHYRPCPEARSEVRASFGVGDSPLIIYVGSFHPWQDVAGLLQAFALVSHKYPKARLALVGDGLLRQVAAQDAIHLGIHQSVQFTGPIAPSEIPRLLGAADIAVAPYRKMDLLWGSSMKLFEYMAAGCALVASDMGQIAEVIQDGVNGLLVPAGDVQALAAALVRLIGDPDLRSRLGSQARSDAVQKYSWENYMTRLERVYETAISQRRAILRSVPD